MIVRQVGMRDCIESILRGSRRPAVGFLALFVLFLVMPASLAGGELRYGQGLLWRIEGAGGLPSYLFGTVHISEQRVLALPEPVRDAFDGTTRAVFEIVLTPEAQGGIGQAMILQDGRTLDGILGPELFAEVAATANRYGLPTQALRLFKPRALIAIFNYPPHEFARIAGGAAPLDEWLQAESQRQGKSVYGLETPEEQIALFDSMPEDEQIDMVRTLVAEAPLAGQRFEDTIRLYLARDLTGISTLLVDEAAVADPEAAAAFEQRFIVERNRRMADGLSTHLDAGGAFVAVGALHLPGDEGLLSLLADRGYSISHVY